MPPLRASFLPLSLSHALAFALAVALLLTPASAAAWAASSLPNPQSDAAGVCGRGGVTSSVCDPDGLLSQSDADTIDGFINFIQTGTHGFSQLVCGHSRLAGAQLAVAVVNKIDCGRFCLGSQDARAFEFAKTLHDTWGVGDPACQNGVVLFVAVGNRAMGLSVGKGVKGVLRDDMVPAIMDVMKPKMRAGEYGQAILDGVNAIGAVVSGKDVPIPVGEDASPSSFLFPLLFGAGCLAMFARKARRTSRYKQCKEALRRIDNDRERARNNEYISTSCPICLADFDGGPEKERGESGHVEEAEIESKAEAAPLVRVDANGASGAKETQLEEPVKSITAGDGQRRDAGAAGPNDVGGSDEREAENAVTTLPCGHQFHENCVLEWFAMPNENSSLCPICRQSVLQTDAIEPRTNHGRPSGWDVYDPEYSFRMQRAQYYYNDFITLEMMNDWNTHRRDRAPMAENSQLVQLDPVTVSEARSSGAEGSSFSFGGGSSAGGGGGGGSW